MGSLFSRPPPPPPLIIPAPAPPPPPRLPDLGSASRLEAARKRVSQSQLGGRASTLLASGSDQTQVLGG